MNVNQISNQIELKTILNHPIAILNYFGKLFRLLKIIVILNETKKATYSKASIVTESTEVTYVP